MAIWQGFDADKELARITAVIRPYEERIAALTAELEAVRRDAEKHARNAVRYITLRGLLATAGRRSINFSGCTPDALDAAIDAAIENVLADAARHQGGHE